MLDKVALEEGYQGFQSMRDTYCFAFQPLHCQGVPGLQLRILALDPAQGGVCITLHPFHLWGRCG